MKHVMVVGAGMVGLSTAWHLQEEGCEVTVVEGTHVAGGSSWGNAGWLAPALTLPLPEPAVLATGVRETLRPSSPVYVPFSLDPRLIRFLAGFARHCTPRKWHRALSVYADINLHSLDAFDELTSSGVSEPTKAADPFLAAFASDADREGFLQEFRHAIDSGGAIDFDEVSGDELRALEPAVGPGVASGVLLRGQRFINPGRFVRALAEAVLSRGGKIVENTTVEALAKRPDGPVEVRTSAGVMHADAVVVATGTWLGDLARPAGVTSLVQAGRGYSFTVQPDHMPTRPIYFPAQRVACTPLGDGFRVAGMMEFRRPDDPLDPLRIKAIIEAAKPMLTGIDWEARTDEWVGSRPCTTDGLPLIGATKTPGVYVSGGHGMWGIVLGPLSGRLLARLISRGETDPLLRYFDPLR